MNLQKRVLLRWKRAGLERGLEQVPEITSSLEGLAKELQSSQSRFPKGIRHSKFVVKTSTSGKPLVALAAKINRDRPDQPNLMHLTVGWSRSNLKMEILLKFDEPEDKKTYQTTRHLSIESLGYPDEYVDMVIDYVGEILDIWGLE